MRERHAPRVSPLMHNISSTTAAVSSHWCHAWWFL